MKKLITALIIISVLSLSLISCEIEEDTSDTSNASNAETDTAANPWDDPDLSEKDSAIRKVSDPSFMKKYGFDDLSCFTVIIDEDQSAAITVRYYCTFAGVRTNEFYTVTLTKDYKVKSVEDWDKGEYSKYLSDEFIKQAKDARDSLDEQTKSYNEEDGAYYFEERSDGYLYICVEFIVDIDPPNVNEFGDTSGCGIDHDHKFFSEKICPVK